MEHKNDDFWFIQNGKNEANLAAFLPGDDNDDKDDGDGVNNDNNDINDNNHEYVDTKICINWNMKIFNRSIKLVFNYLCTYLIYQWKSCILCWTVVFRNNVKRCMGSFRCDYVSRQNFRNLYNIFFFLYSLNAFFLTNLLLLFFSSSVFFISKTKLFNERGEAARAWLCKRDKLNFSNNNKRSNSNSNQQKQKPSLRAFFVALW